MRDRNVGAECVFPIWPREGRSARLLLIQGRKHGRAMLVLGRGLVMHSQTGAFRPEAEAILRGGAALDLG
jgi:tRNA1(Val) A37 N6-methylase TrmN6